MFDLKRLKLALHISLTLIGDIFELNGLTHEIDKQPTDNLDSLSLASINRYLFSLFMFCENRARKIILIHSDIEWIVER